MLDILQKEDEKTDKPCVNVCLIDVHVNAPDSMRAPQ